MFRFTASLIAVAMLATPAASIAREKVPAVKLNASTLTSPASQQVITQKIAQTAENWCRARPAGKTVADCRKTLVAELTEAVDARIELAAKTQQQRMAAK